MLNLHALNEKNAAVEAGDAIFPAPFRDTLEYSPPARGNWNIVHVGMLVPEAHQIYVAAQACLRGVVLTAAEMGAMDRFSTVTIEEKNLIDGKIDELIIDGVTYILNKLPKMPRAVLLFTTCIHNFIGCDLKYVYKTLRERFPQVDFADCYMNLIMRKTMGAADPLMRKPVYSLLKSGNKTKSINLLGNVKPLPESCELVQMLEAGGYQVKDVSKCKDYDEFQSMGASVANISTMPYADSGNFALSERLGQKALVLPLCFDYNEIKSLLKTVSEELCCPMPDAEKLRTKTEAETGKTKEMLKDRAVEIDYLAVPRPLQLAKFMLEHGFNVTAVYGNVFVEGDRQAFEWIKEKFPKLKLYSTLNPVSQFLPHKQKNVVAIGQKAAFYAKTSYFVNRVEGAELWGYDGICRIMRDLRDAAKKEKDINLIQVKGWGCYCASGK